MNGRTIVGVAGIATAAAVGISNAARRNDAGEITEAGAVSAFEVRVGDCFDDGAFENTEVQELPAIPCSQPHDNEIYATFDIPGEWPGVERIGEWPVRGAWTASRQLSARPTRTRRST